MHSHWFTRHLKMSLDSAAASILTRGVELDNKKRYTEAIVCYQEGMQILLDIIKDNSCPTEKKAHLRMKVEEYMKRAEKLKSTVEKLQSEGKYHEQIQIENNSTGHSYEQIFGRFLDFEVISIKIDDPYIRSFHQCQNLVRFCECIVTKCTNLREVNIMTTKDNNPEQIKWFDELRTDLIKYNIKLNVDFSHTLHDREIRLSTGWIIKIGRGLDYFKAPQSKFSLGVFDLRLRTCHETTIDIFHSKTVK